MSDGALLIWRCGGTCDHDATPAPGKHYVAHTAQAPAQDLPIRGIHHRHVCQYAANKHTKPCHQRLVAGTPVYNKVHHSPGQLRTTTTRPNSRGVPTGRNYYIDARVGSTTKGIHRHVCGHAAKGAMPSANAFPHRRHPGLKPGIRAVSSPDIGPPYRDPRTGPCH